MSTATGLLATAGATLVLTQSSIAAPLREWLDRAKEDPWRCDLVHDGPWGSLRCLRRKGHREHGGEAHRFSVIAPQVRRRARAAAVFAKLASCPMCSGFWLGMAAAVALGERGIVSALAHGFGGSVVSALAVALWLTLSEAQSAIGLWRYLHPPPPEVAPAPVAAKAPRFMRPAFLNPNEAPMTCGCCGESVGEGQYHSCILWVVQGARPPAGAMFGYYNPFARGIVCGCGEHVPGGTHHALGERCAGVTSVDAFGSP